MFASLRNKFSNYGTCSLRFDIEENIISEASLRFDNHLLLMYWSVLLLEVSATGPELHLDVSALQRSVLLLEVSATGTELHLYVSALTQRSVLLMEVSATGPELHLDVSALQKVYCSWRCLPQGLSCICTCLHSHRGVFC
jgi:hypothetical protein